MLFWKSALYLDELGWGRKGPSSLFTVSPGNGREGGGTVAGAIGGKHRRTSAKVEKGRL